MIDTIISVLMFSLAVVGLVGFSLVPYRTYEYSRFLYKNRFKSQFLLALPAIGFLVIVWSTTYYKVIFKCLTEMVCGANRAQGVIILALFGCIVLAFEVVRYATIWLYRRHVNT
jgi:hypothetical protein